MIVCIAEKPSVARDIADVLGAREKKDGYIEGNGYQVTWTFGHLCTLKEPHEYTPDWKSWRLEYLPMIPPRFGIKLISNPTYERQFHVIEGLMQKADMIINCGDAGQEGELIQRWVMQKAGARCPVKRLWISSLTEEAIREGFAKLRDASDFQPLYEAGLSRAIGDWLLGMNATRLYTMKYGQNRQVLSIGRVQTPTLALIVNRQLEIENFVPKQYWVLNTVYRDTTFSALIRKSDEELALEAEKQKEAIAAGKKPKKEEENRGIDPITDRERGEELLRQIKDAPFTVISVTKKEGKEAPPRLFDLTSLQVECNKKFAYSADDTLKTIQSLYEKKITTYPRVDTTFLSDDIYPKCPNILKGLRDYTVLTAPLDGKTLPKSKKVFDNSKVTDHHAIIPTGQAAMNLTDMERRVFDLIARRFIAVFYPDCKFSTTTVIGEVKRNVASTLFPTENGEAEAEAIEFKTSGRQILEPGWRVVFNQNTNNAAADADDKDADEDNKVLPAFVKGESGPHVPDLVEKWTQPPRPYTEATLLRAMETAGKLVDNDELRDALKENGIGRPSTRAAIIETLFKRNYIRKEKKNLIATPTGVELIQMIREELLKSAELTGIWEKKLREIEKRTYNAGQFLEELKQMVKEIVATVMADRSNRRITVQAPPAPKQAAAKSPAAADKPKKEPRKRASKKAAQAAPAAEQPQVQVQVAPQPPVDIVGQPCPLCGKGVIIKGKTAYGCSEWRNGCTFRKPFE
ncbi:DNA topoisomerase 3 [Mediterranea massiliensis]|uniref:DNA topoisomerase 3 n=1 Tax=Mediterranea massiliensis TaxID=1841865 RepID=UPI0025A3C11F|nr:DNA topoisomerase 3 [Mediterranea massiliensis]MDM8337892.1 DNA topoisomerase 3 [Mediterranea massiliensis]